MVAAAAAQDSTAVDAGKDDNMSIMGTLLGGDGYGRETDSGYQVDGWVSREVRDHDRTGCTGTEYEDGRWGGLVCKKCGK